MSMQEKQERRVLYVNGLSDSVDEAVLTSAFIAFGEVLSARIVMDTQTSTSVTEVAVRKECSPLARIKCNWC